jgi:hypothetical protein
MAYVNNSNSPPTLVFLNSKTCSRRNPYHFNLAQTLNVGTVEHWLVSVQEFTFANTIPIIRTTNNRLSFNVDAVNMTIIIPPGQYNVLTFKTQINSQLAVHGIACTWNQNTMKYSFVCATAFSLINLDTHPTTCGFVIGVGVDESNVLQYPHVSGAPLHTLEMSRPVNFMPCEYLSIRLSDFSVQSHDAHAGSVRTFVRVPITAVYGGVCVFRPTEVQRIPIQRKTINYFDIDIRLDDDTPVDIGFDFSMSITLQSVYPEDSKDDEANTIPWFTRVVLQEPVVNEFGDE